METGPFLRYRTLNLSLPTTQMYLNTSIIATCYLHGQKQRRRQRTLATVKVCHPGTHSTKGHHVHILNINPPLPPRRDVPQYLRMLGVPRRPGMRCPLRISGSVQWQLPSVGRSFEHDSISRPGALRYALALKWTSLAQC